MGFIPRNIKSINIKNILENTKMSFDYETITYFGWKLNLSWSKLRQILLNAKKASGEVQSDYSDDEQIPTASRSVNILLSEESDEDLLDWAQDEWTDELPFSFKLIQPSSSYYSYYSLKNQNFIFGIEKDAFTIEDMLEFSKYPSSPDYDKLKVFMEKLNIDIEHEPPTIQSVLNMC